MGWRAEEGFPPRGVAKCAGGCLFHFMPRVGRLGPVPVAVGYSARVADLFGCQERYAAVGRKDKPRFIVAWRPLVWMLCPFSSPVICMLGGLGVPPAGEAFSSDCMGVFLGCWGVREGMGWWEEGGRSPRLGVRSAGACRSAFVPAEVCLEAGLGPTKALALVAGRPRYGAGLAALGTNYNPLIAATHEHFLVFWPASSSLRYTPRTRLVVGAHRPRRPYRWLWPPRRT